MEFTPEQKVLNDLFGRDMTYIIPQYQRPYSWDCIGKSDKNNQVNMLWQDLMDFYESKSPNIYFMGSMVLVVSDEGQRVYEVVDGQQRLTTLTILLTAIKCFIKEVITKAIIPLAESEKLITFLQRSSEAIDEIVFNQKRGHGLFTVPEKKVKIQTTTGFNYDNVLAVVMQCGDISSISLADTSTEQREVSMRYFNNRQYFIQELNNKFLDKGILTLEKAGDLDSFFNFLMNKVSIVQIKTTKFEIAYQIFEILNNRGLPLSNKDLFRNFLINKFFELKSSNEVLYKDLDPNAKWIHLETNYELDNEFISRYVESKRGKSQQYSAFNDLQEIYKNHFHDTLAENKTLLFYTDIEANLAVYTKILHVEFEDKRMKNAIHFLLKSGNQSYILTLLLSLFRKEYEETQILDFLMALEKQMIYMLLGTLRFSSKPIYDAINYLNKGDIAAAKLVFDLDTSKIAELKNLFNKSIKENDIAKLVIARYYYAIDNQLPDDVVNQSLDFDKATLEHIIPQTPNSATNWVNDFDTSFREAYTYKLGNMTLLTQKMNSAAKNYDFAKKRETYGKTKLNMTTEIASLSTISPDFIEKRHHKIVQCLIKDLGL